jgi:hypothetical protein
MTAQGPTQPEARNEPHTIDSDWEYEYDGVETEDIYFTLDLTTQVPNAIQEKQYAKNGKLIAPGKNVAASKNVPQDDANGDTAMNDANDEDGHPNNNNNNNNNNSIQGPPASTLQILDLHTEKPYVKFNNGFYTCQWFTDLGTHFWITSPGVVNNPKLSGHVLDVIGSSQTRLVAKPAILKRKRDALDHPDQEPTSPKPTSPTKNNDDDAASSISDDQPPEPQQHQDPTKPMIIPRRKILDDHMSSQADFMHRLSAIKLAKGEKDAHDIPLKIPVYYKGAHNAEALRAAHAATEELPPLPPPVAAMAAADEDTPVPAPITIRAHKRGRPGGGVVSNAARRLNLGLDDSTPTPGSARKDLGLDDSAPAPTPPKKKRGRPSNASKVAAASFAVDPTLAGPFLNRNRILTLQVRPRSRIQMIPK